MIEKEYSSFCNVGVRVKYNILYNRCLTLNMTCANYVWDLLKEGYLSLTTERQNKLLELIKELLGHEVYYGKQEFHTRPCYFGVVDDDFEITEDNIKALDMTPLRSKIFEGTVTTDYLKVLYAYPAVFGELTSIKNPDSRQFLLLNSFTKSTITIDNVLYNVYLLTRPSSVDDYRIIFV